MEKNVLKSLVERDLKSGKSQHTMSWGLVAKDLVSHFKTIVQPAGAVSFFRAIIFHPLGSLRLNIALKPITTVQQSIQARTWNRSWPRIPGSRGMVAKKWFPNMRRGLLAIVWGQLNATPLQLRSRL